MSSSELKDERQERLQTRKKYFFEKIKIFLESGDHDLSNNENYIEFELVFTEL